MTVTGKFTVVSSQSPYYVIKAANMIGKCASVDKLHGYLNSTYRSKCVNDQGLVRHKSYASVTCVNVVIGG